MKYKRYQFLLKENCPWNWNISQIDSKKLKIVQSVQILDHLVACQRLNAQKCTYMIMAIFISLVLDHRFSKFLCLFDLFFNFKGSLLSEKIDISYISSLKLEFWEKNSVFWKNYTGGAHFWFFWNHFLAPQNLFQSFLEDFFMGERKNSFLSSACCANNVVLEYPKNIKFV